MLAGLLAILSSIFGAIFSFLGNLISWAAKTFPWWVWVSLIVAIIVFYYGVKAGYDWAGGQGGLGCSCRSCRQFVCNKQPRPPRPERTHTVSGSVVSVSAANAFVLSQGPRRQRTVTIRWCIVTDAIAGQALTASLLPEGSQVRVEALGGRIMGAEEEEREATPEEEVMWKAAIVEGRGPLVGEVQSASGNNVGLSLCAAGFAEPQVDAPKSYQDAAKQAKSKKKKH